MTHGPSFSPKFLLLDTWAENLSRVASALLFQLPGGFVRLIRTNNSNNNYLQGTVGSRENAKAAEALKDHKSTPKCHCVHLRRGRVEGIRNVPINFSMSDNFLLVGHFFRINKIWGWESYIFRKLQAAAGCRKC